MRTHAIPLDSDDMTDLKEDDVIYTVELEKDENGIEFKIRKLLFMKYLHTDIHIEGLENTNSESIIAELKDPNHNVGTLKTDISVGYFKSPKEACESFYHSIEELYKMTKTAFEKLNFDELN